MPIEIPEGGLGLHQATDVISGILNSPPAEPLPDNPASDAPPDVEIQPDPEPDPKPVDTPEPAAEMPADESEPALPSEPEPSVEPDQEDVEIDQDVLARFLGVNESDLVITDDGLTIKTAVDGESAEVSLKGLKDSFQFSKSNTLKANKLSEDRKSFEAKKETELKALEGHQQNLGYALQALEQQYANDWQQVNWQQLRDEDPEQYNLKRQDYDDRVKQIDIFKQQVVQSIQETEKHKQEATQKAWNEGRVKLDEIFSGEEYEKAPKWDEKEGAKLGKWMVEAGFSAEELSDIKSHLVFKWARDSMLKESITTASNEAVKKVVKLPRIKMSKPGSKQAKGFHKKTKIEEAKSKQRKAAKIGSNPGSRKSNMKETVNLIETLLNRK